MRPATAKAKGRETEALFVDFLQQPPWNCLYVERRRLNGSADRGDIAGIPGVVIEVKSGARIDCATWIAELRQEMFNDRCEYGFVAIRPKGQPNPAGWWALSPLPVQLALLAEADLLPRGERP